MSAASQPGQLLFAGFEGTRVPADLAALVAEGRIGGVVLFARNVESPAQLRALVDGLHAAAPAEAALTLAVDQEGGRVQRCRAPWTEWPAMRRLGQRDRVDETRCLAGALGRELADLRIDLDFAPCVDLDGGPAEAVIGDRSFSPEPGVVARHAVALIEGLRDGGVAACAKHFPGHGGTLVDSHFELPCLERGLARLRSEEFVPFAAAVRAGVASMMTAHILLPDLDPSHPCTLSPAAIGLLRDELDYDGLIFSDDLEMQAVADRFPPEERVRRALEAGVDGLLVCRDAALRQRVLGTLEALPAATLAPGLRRMAEFKRHWSGGRNASGGAPPYAEHLALAARLHSPEG